MANTETKTQGTTNPMPADKVWTTGARLKRLRELSDRHGPELYEMVAHVDAVLSDRQYLDAEYQGDEARAGDELQHKYFSTIGGLM